jgi:hypothetical protein
MEQKRPKDQDGQKDDESDDKLDIKELEGIVLNKDEQKMLEDLDQDIGFQVAVQELIVSGNAIDAIELQTKLLLLLYQFFEKRIDDHKELRSLMERKDKSINDDVAKLSVFIMQSRSQILKQFSLELDIEKYLTNRSIATLRNTIKRFVVYEMYKFITPKKIAGETKKQNFTHNMLVGGLKRASRYAGGSKSQVAGYGKAFVQKLDRQHKKLARGGGIIRM